MPAQHIVHVNGHTLRANRKHGRREPVIVYRRGRSGKASYAEELEIVDPQGRVIGRFTYQPEHPLRCSAVVWAEISPEYRLRQVMSPGEPG